MIMLYFVDSVIEGLEGTLLAAAPNARSTPLKAGQKVLCKLFFVNIMKGVGGSSYTKPLGKLK